MAAGDGLISMKPTSIDHVGTSAVINADGGVDFTAVTSLSLNGVFTSDYDNYLIVISGTSSATTNVFYRLRVSGSDASGSNYTQQQLVATGSTASGQRFTGDTSARSIIFQNALLNGGAIHFYGPALAQPTASRSVTFDANSSARITDYAVTHSVSTAYDGITFFTGSATTCTGNIHVFGYEE